MIALQHMQWQKWWVGCIGWHKCSLFHTNSQHLLSSARQSCKYWSSCVQKPTTWCACGWQRKCRQPGTTEGTNVQPDNDKYPASSGTIWSPQINKKLFPNHKLSARTQVWDVRQLKSNLFRSHYICPHFALWPLSESCHGQMYQLSLYWLLKYEF